MRKKDSLNNITQKIDKIALHKILGLPIFFCVIFLLFEATFYLGNIPIEWMENEFYKFNSLVSVLISNQTLRSLIVDGVLTGMESVLVFVPTIIILFTGISILEKSGYIHRVSHLLDGFFKKFGLQGKSIIPLVVGFGCTAPAYLAANKMIKNPKEKIITMMVLSIIPCNAKIPVLVLFTGMIFGPEQAGVILFLIYLFTFLFVLISAKFLEKVIFRKYEQGSSQVELPNYKFPSIKLLYLNVYQRTAIYIKKIAVFIALASVLIWVLSNYPKDQAVMRIYDYRIADSIYQAATEKVHIEYHELKDELNREVITNSFLGKFGRAINPIFKPMDFDWKLTVGLVSGLAGKEIVVSTLGILYSLEEQQHSLKHFKTIYEKDKECKKFSLIDTMKHNVPIPVGVAYIVFFLFYTPCLAAISTFAKQTKEKKYTIYLILFTTISAWILSFFAYHITKLFI